MSKVLPLHVPDGATAEGRRLELGLGHIAGAVLVGDRPGAHGTEAGGAPSDFKVDGGS